MITTSTGNKFYNFTFIGIVILSLIFVVTIYSDILNHTFLNWDDVFYVANNPYLAEISLENFAWMFTDYKTMNWHPLTWLSYNLEFSIFGKNPVVLKFTNVVIHIINCFILYLLFLTILNTRSSIENNNVSNDLVQRNKLVSLVAASFFLIHPQHVESVVWIIERKDVLCSFFYFSTIYFYLKFHTEKQKNYYYLSLLAAVLATMSKPMAVSIPLALLVIDFFILNRIKLNTGLKQLVKDALGNKLVYIALSLFIASITLLTQNEAIKDLETIGLSTRIINASVATLHYLGTVVYPAHITPFYPFNSYSLEFSALSLIPILIIALLAYGFVRLNKKGNSLYLFSLLFYAVTILPVIGLVAVGSQAYADRYSYIPTSMFYLAIAFTVGNLIFRPSISSSLKTVIVFSCILFYISIGVLSFVQIKNWRNDEMLWSKVVDQFPDQVFIAHQNLGNSHLVKREFDQAVKQYQKALNIDPDSAKTYENLGRAYSALGEKDKEIKNYLIAIEKKENAFWPRILAGYYYLAGNKIELAATHLDAALSLNPDAPPALMAKAKLEVTRKNYNSAIPLLSRVLQFEPENTEALWILAQLNYSQGNRGKSRALLEKLLAIAPENGNARKLLTSIDKSKTRINK